VFVVFESGLAKRSKVSEWNVKGRAIYGVAVAKLSDKGGDLVGALTVDEDDEVLVIFEKGNVVRSRVDEVRLTGRNTMGVQFAKAGKNDAIVGIALNPERAVEEAVEAVEAAEGDDATAADEGVTGTASDVVAGDDHVSGSGPAGSGVAVEGDDAVPSVDDEDEGGRE
jgi:DNA gyrase subunit A